MKWANDCGIDVAGQSEVTCKGGSEPVLQIRNSQGRNYG
jgi:hypothetical protein